MDNYQTLYWFAVQTTYNRELKLKKQLEEKEIECFIPMMYEEVVKNERKLRIEVPAIHNLVFVHSTRVFLDDFLMKRCVENSAYYIMNLRTKEPIVISDRDMRNFILVASTHQDKLIYLNNSFEGFSTYSKVRVTGGMFEGVEGFFVRIRRDRKVIVLLHGVSAIAISGIHHSLIATIE